MSTARYPRDGAVRSREVALLVVDMQHYCATPGRGLHSNVDPENIPVELQYFFGRLRNTTTPAIQKLLAAFRHERKRGQHADVVYTYIESLTKDSRDQSLDYKLSGFSVPKGDPDAPMLEQIAPDDDDIMISKTACSVFNSTNIEYVLRNLGVTQLVITGILSNQCVESAVRDAADRGFYVIVPEEAIATKDEVDHNQALKNMKGFARICSYTDILTEIKAWK